LSPTTTELERYFGANAANEWDLLLGHIEFSSGFALIVLLVPDNTAGEVCERDLERVLESQGKHLERAPTGGPGALYDLPQWLLNRYGHSDVSAIWIKAITTKPPSSAIPEEKGKFARWEHAWKEAISRLNERRDTLKSRYACPVIFVGAPWLKVLLRENAPDLWSVRKLVIELQPEATQGDGINEGMTVGVGFVGGSITDGSTDSIDIITDPDFAMKRLDEATTKKQRLNLLNRAYDGFMARGRYVEALNAAEQTLKLELESNERAQQLDRLGIVLRKLGRREEALSVTQDAVNLFRKLFQVNPQAFSQDLATSLINLGNRFGDVGQREEALATSQEAVSLFRILVQANPQSFSLNLAASLNNLGVRLNELGQREEALTITQESVDLRRELARSNPHAFKPGFAASLNNLGAMLSLLGQREEALTVMQEVVHLRRELARDFPAAFNTDLADSLNNLGNVLSDLGRRNEALIFTQEAVELYRNLAQNNSQTFNPDLARSLSNLGNLFGNLGRFEEALTVTQEAVNLKHGLAQRNPQVFNADLAMSLNNLGIRFNQLGRHQAALSATQQAVDLYRDLARSSPQAFNADLAMGLNNLGNALSELGQLKDALSITQEAVYLRRTLARENPPAFNPDLADSLNNLGHRLKENNDLLEAHQAYESAIRTLAPYYLAVPQAHMSRMSDLLQDYLESCQTLNLEPDVTLIEPIQKKLKELEV
jgi:tetratricopeptide (TPR) repeat protein